MTDRLVPLWRTARVLACTALGMPGLWAQAAVTAPVATPLRAYRNGLQDPARIATDATGRVYLTDAGTGQVIIRDESGRLLLAKGGFSRPLGIATDVSGRIFVGEAGPGSVSILLSTGARIGSLGQGPQEFLLPNHIAIDPGAAGLVYVADSAANLIKVYSPNGPKVCEFGAAGSLDGQFDFPTGLFVSAAGEVFVADQNNNRVQVFTLDGQFVRSFGRTGGRMGMGFTSPFGRLQGLAGDAQGRIYVADTFNGLVRVVDAAGTMISSIGSFGDGLGQLTLPTSLTVDRNNRLLVVSPGTTRVDLFGLDTFSDPFIYQAGFLFGQTLLTRPGMSVPPGRKHGSRSRHTDHEGRGEQDDREDRDETGDEDRGPARRQDVVTATLTVSGVAPQQILPATIRANGVAPLPLLPNAIIDPTGTGATELHLRFSLPALTASLPDGTSTLYITGQVAGGATFEAATTVTVNPAPATPQAAPGRTQSSTREGGRR